VRVVDAIVAMDFRLRLRTQTVRYGQMFDDVELVLGAALGRMGCCACLGVPDAFCTEASALFALMDAVRL
jgi:hypothetical protein